MLSIAPNEALGFVTSANNASRWGVWWRGPREKADPPQPNLDQVASLPSTSSNHTGDSILNKTWSTSAVVLVKVNR